MRLQLSLLVLIASLVASAQQGASTTPSKKLLFLTHAGLYKHTSLGPAENAVTGGQSRRSGVDVDVTSRPASGDEDEDCSPSDPTNPCEREVQP